jgi:hypothetical protein
MPLRLRSTRQLQACSLRSTPVTAYVLTHSRRKNCRQSGKHSARLRARCRRLHLPRPAPAHLLDLVFGELTEDWLKEDLTLGLLV